MFPNQLHKLGLCAEALEHLLVREPGFNSVLHTQVVGGRQMSQMLGKNRVPLEEVRPFVRRLQLIALEAGFLKGVTPSGPELPEPVGLSNTCFGCKTSPARRLPPVLGRCSTNLPENVILTHTPSGPCSCSSLTTRSTLSVSP